MQLVRELERDLKIATVICMVSKTSLSSTNLLVATRVYSLFNFSIRNKLCFILDFITLQNGRRHLTSSMHEVSRDLIVTENSRKKQALLVLTFPNMFFH